ncbi:MAG: hypothetical protein KA783_08025 [Chitinophagales bacterium]|jgi:hypothetical protein|nr:hypothetical protein [Chitinophagales bacterium]MBP7534381.1 hypothetical protein [Chitinophagales bacterium]
MKLLIIFLFSCDIFAQCSLKEPFYTNQTFIIGLYAEGYNFVGFTDFQDSIRLFINKKLVYAGAITPVADQYTYKEKFIVPKSKNFKIPVKLIYVKNKTYFKGVIKPNLVDKKNHFVASRTIGFYDHNYLEYKSIYLYFKSKIKTEHTLNNKKILKEGLKKMKRDYKQSKKNKKYVYIINSILPEGG